MRSVRTWGRPREAEATILLHGFAGAVDDWAGAVAAAGLPAQALALPGHHPEVPCPERFEAAVDDLLARLPEAPVDLAGYSLGGRLALGIAARAPDRVRRLLLVSSHTGLEGADERRARLERDGERAARLRTDAEAFFAGWDALPLFGDAAGPAVEAHRARRRAHDPRALAAALSRLSPGAMPSLRPALAARAAATTLCVGEHDARYRAHYAELHTRCPGLRCEIVPGAHHRVPVDRPEALGAVLRRWKAEPVPRTLT
jgi:2-succinyl-6-hydroxy-2,4-cyclohexadiene-1-carboxylate synthase